MRRSPTPRDGRSGFARRYRTALRVHVRGGADSRPGAAGRLGTRACELGIETLALARIHESAVTAMDLPESDGARNGDDPFGRSESFFAEVVAPIKVSHRTGAVDLASARGRLSRETGRRRVAQQALATNKSEHRVLLRKGAVDLASAKGLLTRETGRRRVAQKALATNKSEHRVLLKKGAVDLASARGRLTRETDRRKVTQEALTTSEGELLAALERSRGMEEELRQLSRSLLTSHEEERKRISRELHDTLGQMLTAVNVGLASLNGAELADSKTFRGTVLRTQRMVQKSMRTVHQFARSLRPTLLDDLGLVPALVAFVKEFGKKHGIKVVVRAPEESADLDGDRRTALFRVAQEALVNVGRHAGARKVRVTLLRTSTGMRLDVWNDGTPFDVERALASKTNRHLGLLCMRERMDMVGGAFSVLSSKKDGTNIRAEVPLPEHSDL